MFQMFGFQDLDPVILHNISILHFTGFIEILYLLWFHIL